MPQKKHTNETANDAAVKEEIANAANRAGENAEASWENAQLKADLAAHNISTRSDNQGEKISDKLADAKEQGKRGAA